MALGLALAISSLGSFCLPQDACWPNASTWALLNISVNGELAAPGSQKYANASAMMYPNWRFAEGHSASALALPAFTITPRTAADVQMAIRFAARHRVRVSVKSTGHTYTGRSTAAGSLLLYLHAMRNITLHRAFNDGCGSSAIPPPPAVTVQPGVDFAQLYPAVDAFGNYVVVGGGGATVGAAGGYVQGGGHSSLSRSLGLAADNVLHIDLVLPNGTLVGVSPCHEPDLWFALRGGGGGTFGVVVALTHRLHPAHGFVGLEARYPMSGTDANVTAWLRAVVEAQPAISTRWGCYLQCLPAVGAFSKLAHWVVSCLHYGGNVSQAAVGIAPLKAAFDTYPARKALWTMQHFRSFLEWKQSEAGATDTTGVATVLTSRIFPPSTFYSNGSAAISLTTALLHAVNNGVNLQIALLLGGAAGGTHDNAVSEHMRKGLWHVVGASGWIALEPDSIQIRTMEKVRAFGSELRDLAPLSGAYLNENDWLEPQWQNSFFGTKFARLLQIKARVDPTGLFQCHNCVGSNDTAFAV